MTISSSDRKAGPFTGNDVTTEFPFEFKVFTTADVYVVSLDTATESETELVLDSDYTVTLNADQNADPGGTVTLGSALETGYTLTITSMLDYLQPTDLTNQGGFYPSVITDALDRACIQIQQLAEMASRSAMVPLSSTVSAADLTDYIILLGANYDTLALIASYVQEVVRMDMTEDTTFTNPTAYRHIAFLNPVDGDYEYIPSGTINDGREIVIVNSSSQYNIKFQGQTITPGIKQSFVYDAENDIYI